MKMILFHLFTSTWNTSLLRNLQQIYAVIYNAKSFSYHALYLFHQSRSGLVAVVHLSETIGSLMINIHALIIKQLSSGTECYSYNKVSVPLSWYIRSFYLMVLKIEKVYNHQYLSDLRSPKKKSSTFKQFMKLRNVYLNQRVFAEGSYTIEQMLHIPLFACSSIKVWRDHYK